MKQSEKVSHSPTPLNWPMLFEYVRRPLLALPEKEVGVAAICDEIASAVRAEVNRAYEIMTAQAGDSMQKLTFSRDRLLLFAARLMGLNCILCNRPFAIPRVTWDIQPVPGAVTVKHQFGLRNVIVCCERDGFAKGDLAGKDLVNIICLKRVWKGPDVEAHDRMMEAMAVGNGWPLERMEADRTFPPVENSLI